MVTRIIYYI